MDFTAESWKSSSSYSECYFSTFYHSESSPYVQQFSLSTIVLFSIYKSLDILRINYSLFLILTSKSSLLVYKNTIHFLYVYLLSLLYSFIQFQSVYIRFLEIIHYQEIGTVLVLPFKFVCDFYFLILDSYCTSQNL